MIQGRRLADYGGVLQVCTMGVKKGVAFSAAFSVDGTRILGRLCLLLLLLYYSQAYS